MTSRGYQVVEDDTLWGIAEQLAGDGMGWLDLYEVNEGVVGKDPDLIHPGLVLDICVQTLLTGEGDNDLTVAADEQRPVAFVSVATGLFPALDAGEDGFISSNDLDAAMSNPDLTVDQAAALITLRRLRGELEELSNDEWSDENDGVTMADLRECQRTGELPGAASSPDAWFKLAYDRGSDTVTLRNPWGRGENQDDAGQPVDGNDDGTFTLSTEDCNRLYSNTTYAESSFGGDE